MGNSMRRRRLRPAIERLDQRWLPAGFSPTQIAAAYGLANLELAAPGGGTVRGDGAGQTIAIVAAFHNPNVVSDLQVFSQTYGLPPADVTVVNLGGDATNDVWASESAMDVQWAHALAPGASIVLVEAASDSADDVLAAVDVARKTPGVVAVSMSFGFTETAGQHVYDDLFTTPAGHTGVTFIAASGDHGPAGGAMYPASSANVLGVGGTSLALDESGAVQWESVWAKSGSGPGRYTTQPAFQKSFQQTGRRSTPDVSFLGDPATGVAAFVTTPGASEGSWRVLAGTSLGAPAWAAIVAIAAQGRALHGLPSLDGPSETLPRLYSLADAGFRSVANPGAATAAGLGVPIAESLIPNLITSSATVATAQQSMAAPPAPRPTPVPVIPTNPRTLRRTPAPRPRRTPAPIQAPTPVRQARLVRQALRERRSLVGA